MFAPYIHSGGFSYDDWQKAAVTHFHGFGATYHLIFDPEPRRPLGALYFAVVHSVLGRHEHQQVALVVALHVLVGLLLFAVMRELRLDRASAAAAAALTLLYPYADSSWLWITIGQVDLCAAFWLVGAALALRGLRSAARGALWHAGALAAYAASLLIYEQSLFVIALTGAVYLLCAPARLALRRWALDIGALAVCCVLFTSQLFRWGGRDLHVMLGFAATLDHAQTIADQGLTIAVDSLLPFAAPGRWPVAAAVVALVAAAAVVARRTSSDALRGDLARWLLVAGAGVAVTIAGWAILAPADPYYSPGVAGVGNRINILAGVGIPVLAVALLRLVTTLGLAGDALAGTRRWGGPVVVLVATAAIAASYLDRLDDDRGHWVDARRDQGYILAGLRQALRPPPPRSTVIARGFPLYTAPGIPVFAASWDLDGAVQLLWDDPTLTAWPAAPGSVTCGSAGISVSGVSDPHHPASYGRAFIVDVPRRAGERIDTAARCRALLAGS